LLKKSSNDKLRISALNPFFRYSSEKRKTIAQRRRHWSKGAEIKETRWA